MAAAGIDKGKALEQAQKYILKGQIDKAIAEYQTVVDADPKDLRTRLKMGELYLKKGNKAAAVDEYSKVAESYTSDGFNLQAIAVYKQLLKIDTSIHEIYVRLAELYKRQGLVADALAQYRIVISNYEKQGKVREAMDTLRQMASMDPENFSIRAKLADLYLKSGNRKDALEEYGKIADDLINKGRVEDVIVLYEKLLSSDPSCTEALREIGGVYLKTGKKKEALSKLQAAIKGNPNDLKALLLLAEAYRELNDIENAKLTYEHALRVDVGSIEAGKGIAGLLIMAGDIEAAIKAVMPVIDRAIEKNSYDNALGILLEFYQKDFKGPLVLEKMAEIYRLKGETDKEAKVRDEIAQLSGAARKVPEVEEISVTKEPELLEIEEAPLEEVNLEEVNPEEVSIEEPPLEEHFTLREEAPAEEAAADLSKYLTEAEVYAKYGLKDKAVDILKAAYDSFPGNIEIGERLASLGVPVPGAVEEALPELEELPVEFELPEEEVEIPEMEEVEEIGVVEEEEKYPLSKVKDDLDEAEFYIQQGLYEEARSVCSRIIESYPDNEEALLKVRAIDEGVKAQLSQPAPPAEEPLPEGFFDLAAELEGEEFEAVTMPSGMREAEKFGFEDIFSEFKKGVDSQLEKEDTETHYNLGIAYKEMGLLDDAIREFKVAAADPKMEFDCYNLIGICCVEKGSPKMAVDAFKKGLEIPGRSNDEYASMNYELGNAYELAGMATEALASYAEAQKRSPGFRDVAAKIAGLGGTREVKKGRVSYL